MATVTKARITARKGDIAQLPKLLPGELGLATDVQKVFMGMEPIQGSKGTCTLTEWQYEFTVGSTPITESFIELLNEVTYSITIDPFDSTTNIEVPGSLISFEDETVKINVDGLILSGNRVPDVNDIVYFNYNREFGYNAEAFPNPPKTITFAKAQAAGTPENIIAGTKEVSFLIDNKDSITLDYTLSVATGFRHGTLKILIDKTGTATNSSIKDEYDISNGTVPVEFSLVADGDKWLLAFDTDTLGIANSYEFTYIQKSFK